MEVKDRFEEILKHYNLNANSMAKKIDSPSTSIRNIINGQSKPGFDLLQKILTTFRDLNAHWLITGEGLMLNDTKDQTLILSEPLEPYGKSVKEILRDKDLQIEELRELIRLKG